jgi:taurine dioxygenase
VRVTPLTRDIGAEIEGVDLAGDLSADVVEGIKEALLAHQVLFFRRQPMTAHQQVAFARHFGEIDLPLFRTDSSPVPEVLILDQVAPRGEGADSWHADNTYMETPPMASILQALKLPSVGGDTCFASMTAAYDALSPAMRTFLDGLHAEHSLSRMVERTRHLANVSLREQADRWPPVVHPVVRVHPQTGARLLNVNANWTSHIVELEPDESDALLALLYRHLGQPAFQVRFRWEEGSVAFWDNRCVQHLAVPDYDERRVMQRVTLTGDRPRAAEATTGTSTELAGERGGGGR